MPYVNIRITREGATREQKAQLIAGVTDLLYEVLDKQHGRRPRRAADGRRRPARR